MDAYWTAEQLTVTSLQGVVNWMLDHDWWRHGRWLRCLPIGFGLIQLGWQCFLPAEFTETNQTFFALIRRRI
jgi:hypothetical protein